MRLFKGMGLAALGTIGFVGCADEQPVQTTPQGLKVAVAPLTLPGIDEACYDILVENGEFTSDANSDGTLDTRDFAAVGGGNDVVVLGNPSLSKANGDTNTICSTQYGNSTGGDITYIAPCDASSDSDPTTASPDIENSVTLWVDGLYSGGADIGQYQNPCGTAGCQLHFDCNENEDTLVEFNFTIMRDANQGFFDVAVNFEDIFCSAKFDCKYDTATGSNGVGDDIIRLVHDGSGTRVATSVLGFACTDGDANDDTRLYMSNLTVDCDADGTPGGARATYTIEVDADGNVFGTSPLATNPAPAIIAQAMVFQGQEQLNNGVNPADKLYWNVAIGWVEAAGGTDTAATLIGEDCIVSATMTASKGDINTVLGGANVTYPYIDVSVLVSDASGVLTCGQYPLGTNIAADPGNGVPYDTIVNTTYTDPGVGITADWEMSQDANDDLLIQTYVP